jgi:hypothetical protein
MIFVVKIISWLDILFRISEVFEAERSRLRVKVFQRASDFKDDRSLWRNRCGIVAQGEERLWVLSDRH